MQARYRKDYPGTATGATVTTPPAAPGMTVITFTALGTYTAQKEI